MAAHVVIFPFMAYGHTLPLLDLSKAFSARGLTVTIITTPSNSPSITTQIRSHPNISIKLVPFPSTPDLPQGCENTSHLPTISMLPLFLRATLQLQHPFHHTLQQMSQSGSLPICVVSDFFMSWTADTCRQFDVPTFVFHGMSLLTMAISKTIFLNVHQLVGRSETEPLHVPGVNLPFSVTLRDMPDSIRALDLTNPNPLFAFLSEVAKWEALASGYLINTFTDLEGEEHVAPFEAAYRSKAWCVGPMFMLHDDEVERVNESSELNKWLDGKASHSVIYVSFGSQTDMADVQLDEVGYGLERSGHPFIWAVRSNTWVPPHGMEERIKRRGRIVRDWVDQRAILAHRATGGFMSHCGWNSVLESLCRGVPILAWSLLHDQHLNAKFVVEGVKAGLRVLRKFDAGVEVEREVVCEAIIKLMGSEDGREVRAKAEHIGKLAKQAVGKGGSADNKLNEFVGSLCQATFST